MEVEVLNRRRTTPRAKPTRKTTRVERLKP